MNKSNRLWLSATFVLIGIILLSFAWQLRQMKIELERKAEKPAVIEKPTVDQKKDLFESFTPIARAAAERIDTLLVVDTLPPSGHTDGWKVFYNKTKDVASSYSISEKEMVTNYLRNSSGTAYTYCIKKTDYYTDPKGGLPGYVNQTLIHYGAIVDSAVVYKRLLPAGTYVMTVNNAAGWSNGQSSIWDTESREYYLPFTKLVSDLKSTLQSKGTSPHCLDTPYKGYQYDHSVVEYYIE